MESPIARRLTIPSGDLSLEAAVYLPGGGQPASMVVVCHPHPQRGGDMQNNVVMAAVRALVSAGIGALNFNFRGVGLSQGSFDSGSGERDDVRAAIAACRGIEGVERVGLAGYSFGAGMAATVVDDSAECLALVSPSVALLGRDEPLGVRQYAGPVLIVAGDADQANPTDALREAVAGLPGQVDLQVVAGADHFWWGHETRLVESLRGFFARHL